MLVEDDTGLQSQLRWALEAYDVAVAGDRAAALAKFRDEQPPVVVLDLGLPPDPDGATEGLQCLKDILAIAPETKVIISSGNEERANAVEAIAQGAYDFYAKPVDIDVLNLIIQRALHVHTLEREHRVRTESSLASLSGLVTSDPGMLKVCRTVEKVAPTGVSVMLLGESGTGKDVIARAIHQLSPRASRAFVAINCAAIPENLLESELFGHEKGAFTGAIRQTVGKIETANRGTFFLDEIGDLPLSLQAKLLRFLQDRVIERVGGRQQIPVDVRIISATNKNIPDLIRDGRFREDLFYRLNEIRIDIPPLRDRAGDVVLLINYFISEFNRQLGRNIKGLAQDAIEAVLEYNWPGNVREVENRVKRAVIMAEGRLLTAADLDFLAATGGTVEEYDLRVARERSERSVIQRALLKEQGNISKAARLLGISRPTLYELMKHLNIKA
ncbi:MAG: PEP-CTERM-box response regulator transcription factor [Alphaproteobacteria bacterium]|nr:PEP-CTERM-box response regulator transcription factor [Alphaproteobacteria bacterium]